MNGGECLVVLMYFVFFLFVSSGDNTTPFYIFFIFQYFSVCLCVCLCCSFCFRTKCDEVVYLFNCNIYRLYLQILINFFFFFVFFFFLPSSSSSLKKRNPLQKIGLLLENLIESTSEIFFWFVYSSFNPLFGRKCTNYRES